MAFQYVVTRQEQAKDQTQNQVGLRHTQQVEDAIAAIEGAGDTVDGVTFQATSGDMTNLVLVSQIEYTPAP